MNIHGLKKRKREASKRLTSLKNARKLKSPEAQKLQDKIIRLKEEIDKLRKEHVKKNGKR
jgi:hypothetical protein